MISIVAITYQTRGILNLPCVIFHNQWEKDDMFQKNPSTWDNFNGPHDKHLVGKMMRLMVLKSWLNFWDYTFQISMLISYWELRGEETGVMLAPIAIALFI